MQNCTREKIVLKKGTRVAQVAAANVVPPMFAPDPSTEESVLKCMNQEQTKGSELENEKMNSDENSKQPQPMPENLNELFTKLDLTGITDWPEDLQQQVHELMIEYQHLFALNDLELGKMSVVKHEIKLSNPRPFKDRYRCIPPHDFDEVGIHLRDMLKVGMIRKSVSPWACPVILVQKKDGSLRFCIDVRKLNSRTIKDAYSLPGIE